MKTSTLSFVAALALAALIVVGIAPALAYSGESRDAYCERKYAPEIRRCLSIPDSYFTSMGYERSEIPAAREKYVMDCVALNEGYVRLCEQDRSGY